MPVPSNFSGGSAGGKVGTQPVTVRNLKTSPRGIKVPVQLRPLKKAPVLQDHHLVDKPVPFAAPKSPTKMRMELLAKEQILPESTINSLNLMK
jgi:hypothetical protein